MAYDYSILNGKIVEVCKTRSEFAKRMNISERTLSLKLGGKVSWKQPEMVRACKVLNIPHKDIPSYFFKLKVQ